jgi:hypothetical protein
MGVGVGGQISESSIFSMTTKFAQEEIKKLKMSSLDKGSDPSKENKVWEGKEKIRKKM